MTINERMSAADVPGRPYTIAAMLDWAEARQWSGLGTPGMILMGLAVIGGGVATTAGGVKLLRVYALYMHGRREMARLVHPSSVSHVRKGDSIHNNGAFIAWVDDRYSVNRIFMQHVDSAGAVSWAADELMVYIGYGTGDQPSFQLPILPPSSDQTPRPRPFDR